VTLVLGRVHVVHHQNGTIVSIGMIDIDIDIGSDMIVSVIVVTACRTMISTIDPSIHRLLLLYLVSDYMMMWLCCAITTYHK
jgi:hypothetical protein